MHSPRCPSCGRPLSFPLPGICPGCDALTDRTREIAPPDCERCGWNRAAGRKLAKT